MSQNSSHHESQEGPQITIQGQYIKDLSFENPKGIQALAEIEEEPSLQVGIQVQTTPLSEENFEVDLILKVEAKTSQTHLYVLDLTYTGIFMLGNMPETLLKPFLSIECPRLLFPFARNIVATMTGDSGFPPLLLAPFDFVSLFQSQINPEKEEAYPPAGNA